MLRHREVPVCRVHTLCTPPSFRLPSARRNTPVCSVDGAFSLHSTNGRKQKNRQNAGEKGFLAVTMCKIKTPALYQY